jgi:hypothetical protein
VTKRLTNETVNHNYNFYINDMTAMTFSSFLPAGIRCLLGLMARSQSREHDGFRAMLTSKQMPVLDSNMSEAGWSREYYSAQTEAFAGFDEVA